jgi:multisubunit Na+/H+ antiporter MnhC subunit
VIAAVLMVAALVLTALVPEVGLYSLLLLLLSTPIERFVRWRFPEVT